MPLGARGNKKSFNLKTCNIIKLILDKNSIFTLQSLNFTVYLYFIMFFFLLFSSSTFFKNKHLFYIGYYYTCLGLRSSSISTVLLKYEASRGLSGGSLLMKSHSLFICTVSDESRSLSMDSWLVSTSHAMLACRY